MKVKLKKIFGNIATVSADNLGAHDLGGFRKCLCFNSGRICRYCMCMYNDLLIKHNESKFRLRTPLMHELHLQAIKQDRSLIRAYGVVSKCNLSDLIGFSPATAFPPDIMHDCLEGVIPVFLHYLFNDLAQNNICIFTIINEKFKKFHFGVCEVRNKPRCLSGNVVAASGHISVTASEAWCIFRLLPFVIGDLVPVRHDT